MAKDETKKTKLETVLYNLLEGLRVVSALIYPVMPDTSCKIQEALGFEIKENDAMVLIDKISQWGQMQAGVKLQKPPILFPRIDVSKK